MFLRSLRKKTIKNFPKKEKCLQWGALLPIALKSYFSYRFFSALATSISQPIDMKTNMGIGSDCLYEMSSKYNHVAIFGKPDYYVGERAALNLSEYLTQYADAFVDIGANMGYFTFFMREHTDINKPIYFFEPGPDLFNLIDNNVRANGFKNIHGFKTAIGLKVGELTFYKNISDNLSGSITKNFFGQHELKEIIVDSTTFSEFAQKNNLKNACVKVDIEGAEFDFIKGAMDSFTSISYLIMEVLGPAIDNKFIEYTIEIGYSAYYINDYSLEHSVNGNFEYREPQYNWLFCHDLPEQLREKLKNSKKLI